MVDSELFSIVIPAYNREKTVARAICSAVNQTYINKQIIVIDDGSKDNTAKVVNEFVEKFGIEYYYQQNGGAQRARNNGLAHAEGEYIIFLDSDDELLPTCLEEMVKVYKEEEDTGAVYCLAGVKSEDGSLKPMRNDYLEGNIYREVLEQGYLTSSSFISMRKRVFNEIGEWDVAFPASQDDDICFRIAKNYRIRLINHILGIYWFDAGEGNQISSSSIRVANGWWTLWNKYEKDVIRLCGSQVMRKHYLDCAYRYRISNSTENYKKGMKKVKSLSTSLEYVGAVFYIKARLMKRRVKKLLSH